MSKPKNKLPDLANRIVASMVFCYVLFWLAACNSKPPSDEQLKQQAAETTQQVKKGAQQTAADAKVAAANAERKVNDIAAGVKQGLNTNGKPAAMQVNINSATEEQLAGLSGITPARAHRIVRGRPYDTSQELVSKGILTKEQYDRISTQIVAQ